MKLQAFLGLVLFFTAIKGFCDPLTLETNLAAPYQVYDGDKISGTAINALDCIFEKLAHPYTIQITPWLRSIKRLEKGLSQGFFTSTYIPNLDNKAELSAPLFLERWHLISLNELKPLNLYTDKSIKVGVIRGNAQSTWLKFHKFDHKIIEVNSIKQLIKLLNLGRVDAILEGKRNFLDALSKENISKSQYQLKFIKYAPMGVYFSTTYLNAHPRFLSNFNSHISSCVSESRPLNDIETKKIYALLVDTVTDLIHNKDVINYINAANQKELSLSDSDILSLDQQWVEQHSSAPPIKEALSHPLSSKLRQVQEASLELISETFIVGKKGLIIGLSHITSDYWQGDEAKIINSKNQKGGIFTFNDIQYDESSGSFQTQVAIAISDPQTNDYIGTLVIGVNPEKALHTDP